MGLLFVNMFVLGASFCFFLIGGLPFRKSAEHAPIRVGENRYSVEMLILAISICAFGFSWFLAWTYFLIERWPYFYEQQGYIVAHLILQFATATGLLVAGYGIFRKWKHFKGIFLISVAILLASLGYSIIIFGPQGYGGPLATYFFAIWFIAIGGAFVTALYLFDRMLNVWDKKLSKH